MRVFGLLLIIAASAGLGFAAADAAAVRYRAMKQVGDMMTLLAGEIRCSFSPFHSAFRSLADRMEDPWSDFLKGMAEELEGFSGQGFLEIWETGVDGLPKDCGLDEDDRRELKLLGKGLGYLDAGVQLETIGTFLGRWQTRTEDVRIELQPRQRMYRCLGISLGLVLALVLI